MYIASALTSATKPDFRLSMTGGPSEEITETIFHERSLSLKTSSKSLFTSTALVVVIVRGLEKKNFLYNVVFHIAREYDNLD